MTRQVKYLHKKITAGFLNNLQSDVDLQITDASFTGLQLRYYSKTGRKVFYLTYRMRGCRQQKIIQVGTMLEYTFAEIRIKAIDLRRDILNGYDPRAIRIKKVQEMIARQKTATDVYMDFLENHSRENNSHSTYKGYKHIFGKYLIPRLGNIPLVDIDLDVAQSLYNKVKNEYTIPTATHALRTLSVFLTWCEKYKHRPINSNPCSRIQKAKAPKFKTTLLNRDGYKRLLAALDESYETGQHSPQSILAIKMLMLTGCRRSEITDLELDELDLENKYLRLKKRKTDMMDVPLADNAIGVLNQALAICKSTRYVFHSSRDADKPLIDIRKAFWWALDRAQLPRMRLHDLRHSFASFAVTMGEDIRSIKDVLGHTKITTTEIYAHATNTKALSTANNVAAAIVGG